MTEKNTTDALGACRLSDARVEQLKADRRERMAKAKVREETSTPSGLVAVQWSPEYCYAAHLHAQENGHRPFSQWDSSHELSTIDQKTGERKRIGTFRHAAYAEQVGKLIEQTGLGHYG